MQCVRRNNKKKVDRYFSITTAQVDRRPLDKMASIFGGKVYGPYGPYKTTKQAYYQWTAYGPVAIQAVKLMLPLLFRKGEQCQRALDEWKEYCES